jgi:hypothetical protein
VEVDYDPLLINEITPVTIADLNQDGFAVAEINYTNLTPSHVS